MSLEIEAKIKVDRLDPYAQRLEELQAQPRGSIIQRDHFFDQPDRRLLRHDTGLRIRQTTGPEQAETIMCFKGPRQGGPYKQRDEIELAVSDFKPAQQFLQALGLQLTLVVEKRRTCWLFHDCEVALDEVAQLGSFVEIEGPSNDAVAQVLKQLDLQDLPIIHNSYAAMQADRLGADSFSQPQQDAIED